MLLFGFQRATSQQLFDLLNTATVAALPVGVVAGAALATRISGVGWFSLALLLLPPIVVAIRPDQAGEVLGRVLGFSFSLGLGLLVGAGAGPSVGQWWNAEDE